MNLQPGKWRRGILVIGTCALCVAPMSVTAAGASEPVYRDDSYTAAERAADLVYRMTLPEKATQLADNAPAIPRLGVRAYNWWSEALHGVAKRRDAEGNLNNSVNTTSYPTSLAMGSTWNPQLVHRVATQISDEEREVSPDNNRDLNIYAPTVNLARDPRWGRNDETYGEDPTLTARLAEQYVDGMEGKAPDGKPLPGSGGYLKVATTLKHYAANNSEHNRHTGSSNMDERTLREYYTKQFREVIKNSNPSAVMSSYNAVNRVPSPANAHLMDTLARRTFGFTGSFTSDCGAIYDIGPGGHDWRPHGPQAQLSPEQRGAISNAAGEDDECVMNKDNKTLAGTTQAAVRDAISTPQGVYGQNFVDTSLVRLFTERIRLGEFDPPERNPWVRAARERVPQGSWTNSDANGAVTETPARLRLDREAADQSIVLLKNDGGLLPLAVPKTGRYRLAVVGDYAAPKQMFLGGYSSDQQSAGKANEVNGFEGIRSAIKKINPGAEVDYLPGSANGDPNKMNTESVRRAAGYDAAVVYAGTDEDTAKEEQDRTSLRLPGMQDRLINAVAARNPNTAVYLETIGQVDVSGFAPHVRSILWSSYNGQRKGEALADVLSGQYNPSGRLPFTWYGGKLPSIEDYSIRGAADNPGRTYMYYRGKVDYPFGHGLSYTKFDYGRLHIDRDRVSPDGTVNATVEVTNFGRAKGTDIAQLYAATPGANPAKQRPVKRLVDWKRVTLDPGQRATLRFPVKVADLGFFDQNQGHFTVDNGSYALQLSSSSADIRTQQTFAVQGQLTQHMQTVSATPHAQGDPESSSDTRVVFDRGSTVLPRLTVAMNDDTLYGHSAEHPDTPLPRGTSVRYTSNRPDVVEAHGGHIETRNPGVATVTADVRYRGQSKQTSFVLVVR
ncbi:glycoside hydrolase family 3 protein [Sciscionella sediminilitoris]|uniref:glycoside hydrolase family 3 protein n=1 Tax=Sciscionella sediminilitoris TaxID=1445613 RepID=UPI0004DF5591|nr:glycoside hydrolase family 3 protein [Sciscionella sp. SE31]